MFNFLWYMTFFKIKTNDSIHTLNISIHSHVMLDRNKRKTFCLQLFLRPIIISICNSIRKIIIGKILQNAMDKYFLYTFSFLKIIYHIYFYLHKHSCTFLIKHFLNIYLLVIISIYVAHSTTYIQTYKHKDIQCIDS